MRDAVLVASPLGFWQVVVWDVTFFSADVDLQLEKWFGLPGSER